MFESFQNQNDKFEHNIISIPLNKCGKNTISFDLYNLYLFCYFTINLFLNRFLNIQYII